jgi:hypothetical protein
MLSAWTTPPSQAGDDDPGHRRRHRTRVDDRVLPAQRLGLPHSSTRRRVPVDRHRQHRHDPAARRHRTRRPRQRRRLPHRRTPPARRRRRRHRAARRQHAPRRLPATPATKPASTDQHRRRHLFGCRGAGLRRLGLLGPRFTTDARYYPDVFAAAGIDIFVPEAAPRSQLHQVYMASSSKAPFDRRREILCSRSSTISNDATASTASSSAETELSLLIDDHTILDLPVLNTTRIHADAAVDALVA